MKLSRILEFLYIYIYIWVVDEVGVWCCSRYVFLKYFYLKIYYFFKKTYFKILKSLKNMLKNIYLIFLKD
jgi:hypothetical protein